MPNSTSFSAPWSQALWLSTGIALTILVAVAIACYFGGRLSGKKTYIFGVLISVGVLLYGVAGAILGYSIDGNQIIVRKLLSNVSIPIEHGTSTKQQPGALNGAIRVIGVGGFFRYSGTYFCHGLGNCQVFTTSYDNLVVISTNGTNYILSPSEPNKFVNLVNANAALK